MIISLGILCVFLHINLNPLVDYNYRYSTIDDLIFPNELAFYVPGEEYPFLVMN